MAKSDEILALVIRRFGGEAQAIERIRELDDVALRELAREIGSEVDADTADINAAVSDLQDQVAAVAVNDETPSRRAIADRLMQVLDEWVVDPTLDLAGDIGQEVLDTGGAINQIAASVARFLGEQVRDNPYQEVRNEVATAGERPAPRDRSRDDDEDDAPDGESPLDRFRRIEREQMSEASERRRRREQSQLSQGEVNAAAARASGIYRSLFDESRGFEQDNIRRPLGGMAPLTGIPVNQERELQDRVAARGGNMSVDAIARDAQTIPEERYPLYMEGDEYAPAGWSEQRIARMQRQLIEAGLLTDTFRRGYWDGPTADAYATLLSTANRTGETWNEALPHVQRAYEQGIQVERQAALAEFRSSLPSYTPNDPAELRTMIREKIRERVRRDPSAAEMATYTEELSRYYRQQYDSEVADARRAIEEQVDSFVDPRQDMLAYADTGQMPASGAAPDPTATTNAPAISPTDRLAELLDQRLGGEMNLLDDKVRAEQSQMAVSAIAGGLMRKVRG